MKLIVIPFPEIPAALQLGEADAACLVEPFFTSVMHSHATPATILAAGSLANLKELGRAPLDGHPVAAAPAHPGDHAEPPARVIRAG